MLIMSFPRPTKPSFLASDVTDDELNAVIAALRAGEYAGWTLQGEVGYSATQGRPGALELCHYRRIWLCGPAGRATVVTLQRLPSAAVWRRVTVEGAAEEPSPGDVKD